MRNFKFPCSRFQHINIQTNMTVWGEREREKSAVGEKEWKMTKNGEEIVNGLVEMVILLCFA